MSELILQWVTSYGYITIFSLLMVGILGVPVPDETIVTFAGYLSSKGDLGLLPSLTAAFLGTACGITLSYGLGRIGGVYLIRKYGTHIHLSEEKIVKIRNWFDRRGRWVLLFGYFLPGVRHLTALTAGTSKLSFPAFAIFAYAGGFLWTLTFISVGYVFGEAWAGMSGQLRHYAILGSSAAAILALAYFFVKWIGHWRKA